MKNTEDGSRAYLVFAQEDMDANALISAMRTTREWLAKLVTITLSHSRQRSIPDNILMGRFPTGTPILNGLNGSQRIYIPSPETQTQH